MPDAHPVLAATVGTRWGPLQVAIGPRGVVAVEWLIPTAAFDAGLEGRLRGPVVRGAGSAGSRTTAAALDEVIARVESYLDGSPTSFDDLPVDLTGRPAWDLAVLGAVRGVAWGSVTSYGRIALAIGRPGAARAVGGAVGRNPVGLIIPCHRVIAGDGSLGGYGGDWWGSRETLLALKRDLLALEQIRIPVTLPRR